MDEFDFIRERLAPLALAPGAFALTDDAAAVTLPEGAELVITADALVAGVHFRPEDPLDLVAGKALRVNLSDLAAKGAEPLGYLLSVVWPRGLDLASKERFVEGLAHDQARFGIGLLGGDTTVGPGPLVVSITALGVTPRGRMVRRAGARPGDVVFVTGAIGDAMLEIAMSPADRAALHEDDLAEVARRYLSPEPRTACALALRDAARAAIDVSDGLLADAGHVARASGVRIEIEAERIPLSAAGRRWLARQPDRRAGAAALAGGGDDYEILFCGPAAAGPAVEAASGAPVTAIGRVTAGEGVALLDADGTEIPVVRPGYSHF